MSYQAITADGRHDASGLESDYHGFAVGIFGIFSRAVRISLVPARLWVEWGELSHMWEN